MAARQAVKASARCGAAAAMTTARSPMASVPSLPRQWDYRQAHPRATLDAIRDAINTKPLDAHPSQPDQQATPDWLQSSPQPHSST